MFTSENPIVKQKHGSWLCGIGHTHSSSDTVPVISGDVCLLSYLDLELEGQGGSHDYSSKGRCSLCLVRHSMQIEIYRQKNQVRFMCSSVFFCQLVTS